MRRTFCTSAIPVIDISAFISPGSDPEARGAVAAEWDNAMSEVGFAVITGHDVPPQCIANLRGAAADFFELDRAAKMQFAHGPYGNSLGGYTPPGAEAVSRSRDEHGSDGGGSSSTAPPDLVESFVFRPEAPTPQAITTAATVYDQEMNRVLCALHRLTAAALDLPENYFEPFYSPHPECFLRMAWYPPLPTDTAYSSSVRYGEHTDYTGFTILHQDENDVGALDAGGLEVRLPSAEWVALRPTVGSFVVNIGDLYEVWTNGRWKSTVHRVANPAAGSKAARSARLSIPFFTGPHNEALIEAMPTCVSSDNPPKHAPVLALDHLLNKLAASNV